MNKIILALIAFLGFSFANANTSINCQATENSLFYGVLISLNEFGDVKEACSSTGGYGCLTLSCERLNSMQYKCQKSYRRLDTKELVTHLAIINIDRSSGAVSVLRSVKEGSLVRANVEKLNYCRPIF